MNEKNRAILFVLNLLIFAGIAYFCYNHFYCEYTKILNERKGVYEKFYNISTQLNDFVNYQTKIDEEKNSIMEVLTIYEDTFYSNEQNKTAYKVKILELLKSLDIPVKDDSVIQEPKEDNVLATININADYERICKLLFELERYSVISKVNMDYKGVTQIFSSPILFSEQINDCFSGRSSIDSMEDDIARTGYFRELYDKIMEVKDIGDVPSWRDFQPIPKSPFYFYVPPKKTGGKGGFVNYGKPEHFAIDGIMYDKKKPIVIIEGKFYYIGSVYKNCKIVQINENNIKVNYYGRVYTIKMEY